MSSDFYMRLICRCSNCFSVIQVMEQEIARANNLKSEKIKQKDALESEVISYYHDS